MTLRSHDALAELVRAELLRVARRLETHGLACAAVLLSSPSPDWGAVAADVIAAHRPGRSTHAEGLAASAMARGDVDLAIAHLAGAEGLSSPEWIAARSGR